MAKQIVFRDSGALGPRMRERLEQLKRMEQQASKAAAKRATEVSRGGFTYKRPPNAPKRPGRSSTGGQLMKKVRWDARPSGGVQLNYQELNRIAPHWIIQEIGTGERATIKRAGQKNPRGRPKKGSQYVRTVKSQKGRRISASLAFGTGPGGQYVPAGMGAGQQLYRRRDLTGASPFRPRRITIQREIVGQHFARDGAQEGFREYRETLIAAARRAFAGQRRRP